MPEDEVWTTRDGTQIAVSDMSEDHVRNVLRMILRKRRERERTAIELIAKVENLPDDQFFERPDNHEIFDQLRQKHGDKVRVERKGVAGLSGGNVYIGDRWLGWFGGI